MRISAVCLSISLIGSMTAMATEPAPTPAPAAATSAAPAMPAPGETCRTAPFRQFDFWLGDWEVFGPKGNKVGENRISLVNKGCTLAEHWTNSGGGEGRSYNAYDGITRRWYQFWSDDQGGTLSLVGGLQGDSMVLEGERPNLSDGKLQKQRISWTPNADGSVRQHWETSDDAGASWQTSFDGSYRRRELAGN